MFTYSTFHVHSVLQDLGKLEKAGTPPDWRAKVWPQPTGEKGLCLCRYDEFLRPCFEDEECEPGITDRIELQFLGFWQGERRWKIVHTYLEPDEDTGQEPYTYTLTLISGPEGFVFERSADLPELFGRLEEIGAKLHQLLWMGGQGPNQELTDVEKAEKALEEAKKAERDARFRLENKKHLSQARARGGPNGGSLIPRKTTFGPTFI